MLTSLLITLAAAQGVQMPYLGRPSVFIDEGVELSGDAPFADGTIDFDVALHGHASFAGIAFRAVSSGEYELIYLRPHRSRQPDALQYTPVFNDAPAWQLYSGDGFTAAAELPANRWLHVKVVVSGYGARVFVGGSSEPQLVVPALKRQWTRGRVGFWGSLGGANFANLSVTPADTTAPPPLVEAAPDPRTLTTWELSPAFETLTTPADAVPALPARDWTAVGAEASGLVNISRYRGSVRTDDSKKRGSRDLVFARTVLTASRAQRMKLVFAYSDAVHLFVNGRLVFEGDSTFQRRDPSYLGIASLGPDAVYVDLRPGANEIVLAVSESFGGWGFAARLEPLAPEFEPER